MSCAGHCWHINNIHGRYYNGAFLGLVPPDQIWETLWSITYIIYKIAHNTSTGMAGIEPRYIFWKEDRDLPHSLESPPTPPYIESQSHISNHNFIYRWMLWCTLCFEVLRFWGFEVLRFWGFEVLRFWGFEVLSFEFWVLGFGFWVLIYGFTIFVCVVCLCKCVYLAHVARFRIWKRSPHDQPNNKSDQMVKYSRVVYEPSALCDVLNACEVVYVDVCTSSLLNVVEAASG